MVLNSRSKSCVFSCLWLLTDDVHAVHRVHVVLVVVLLDV